MVIVEGRCAIIITEIVYVSIIITRTHLEVEGATDQQSDSQRKQLEQTPQTTANL